MKEWMTKKNLKGIFLFFLGLMTLLSLCFNLISGHFTDSNMEQVAESLGIDLSENGFGALDFDVVFSSIEVYDILVGLFSLLPLLVGITAMIVGIASLFIKNETLARKLQTVCSILCVVFVGLYMLNGIITYSVWSASMYWEGVGYDIEAMHEDGVLTSATYTYIPFILIAILYACYIVLPKLIANKIGSSVESVTTTPNVNAKSSATVKSQTERLTLLKEYKEALDAGIITQEEFDEKKQELL